jgi:hypothetical protein
MTRTKRCFFLTIVLAIAVAPTGLSAQISTPPITCTVPACGTNIGDMFGQKMQTNKPNLQNRSGSTKTAPSGAIQSPSRNVK